MHRDWPRPTLPVWSYLTVSPRCIDEYQPGGRGGLASAAGVRRSGAGLAVVRPRGRRADRWESMMIVSSPALGLEFHLNRVAFQHRVSWPMSLVRRHHCLPASCWPWPTAAAMRPSGSASSRTTLIDMLFFAVPLCHRRGAAVLHPLLPGPSAAMRTAPWTLEDHGPHLGRRPCHLRRRHHGGRRPWLVFCKVRQIRFLAFARPGRCSVVLIGQLIGRWGNFVNVEAFGGVTELPWRMCSPSIADYLLQRAWWTRRLAAGAGRHLGCPPYLFL